jgi:hypothetical protein
MSGTLSVGSGSDRGRRRLQNDHRNSHGRRSAFSFLDAPGGLRACLNDVAGCRSEPIFVMLEVPMSAQSLSVAVRSYCAIAEERKGTRRVHRCVGGRRGWRSIGRCINTGVDR